MTPLGRRALGRLFWLLVLGLCLLPALFGSYIFVEFVKGYEGG